MVVDNDFCPYLRDGVDVYVNESDKTVVFVFLSTRQRIQLKVEKFLVLLLPKMDGKNNVSNLVALAGNEKRQQVIDFISYLFEKGVVTDAYWFEELPFDLDYKNKLQKQLFFLMDMTSSKSDVLRVQQKIKNSNVAIWGVGAVGSWLLVELLQMGFEKIKILDFDSVQESDISRHAFFTDSKRNMPKVDFYKELCADIEPNAKVEAYVCAVNTEIDVDKYLYDIDLIINCSDEPYIGYTSIHLSRYCVKNNKTMFVAGGFDAHLACLGELIVPHITPCSDCYNTYFKTALQGWKPIKHKVKNREKGMGGLVSLNVFSASSAALSILRYFVDPVSMIKESGRGEFKFDDYSIDTFNVKRDENCEICRDK